MYLNAVRFKAPGAEVFAPMRFDTYSLIYIVGVMEQLVAEVLELGGNVTHDRKPERCDNHFRKWNPEDHTMTLCHINMAVIDDTELSVMGQRYRWRTDVPSSEQLRLLELRCFAIGQPRVMRTLALLIGREDDGDDYEDDVMYDYKYTPGVLVSKAWKTIFENEAKTQLESDEVRCHIKTISTLLFSLSFKIDFFYHTSSRQSGKSFRKSFKARGSLKSCGSNLYSCREWTGCILPQTHWRSSFYRGTCLPLSTVECLATTGSIPAIQSICHRDTAT